MGDSKAEAYWKSLAPNEAADLAKEKASLAVFLKEDPAETNVHTAVHCIFCGESNVRFRYAQTRSADEGMSGLFQCTAPACGKKWQERG